VNGEPVDHRHRCIPSEHASIPGKQENIALSSTWIEYVRLFFLSISNNFCYVLLLGIFTKKYKKKTQ
jgi:hypothetical protein